MLLMLLIPLLYDAVAVWLYTYVATTALYTVSVLFTMAITVDRYIRVSGRFCEGEGDFYEAESDF